jgi:transcriptional regulator with XRE-family HTH domain
MSLKSLREKRGLTQEELSILAGVSIRTIQSYESKNGRDVNNASLSTLLALSKSLHCSIIDLLDDPELIKMIRSTKMK